MITKLKLHAIQSQLEQLLNKLPKRWIKSLLYSRISRTMLGVAIVLIMSVAFGQTFYTQPQLQAGDIAPQTIVVPKSDQVEDIAATELRKQEARQGFPVFMLDKEKTQTSRQKLQQILKEGTRLRQMLGDFPIVAPSILSQDIQRALRRADGKEWEQVVQNFAQPSKRIAVYDWQERALTQLQRYRRKIAKTEILTGVQDLELRSIFQPLINARQRYQTALSAAEEKWLSQSGFEYTTVLLDLPEDDWQTLKTELPRLAERILAQGLSAGLPQETQQQAFLLNAQAVLPKSTQSLAVRILTETLAPNIAADLDQTQQLADEAVRNVQPVLISVTRNDVIVEQDKIITPKQALLLAYFKLDRRTVNFKKFLQFTLIMGIGLSIFYVCAKRVYPDITSQDYILILLLALITALCVLVGVPSVNLPMIGLLLGSFYNPLLAILTIFGISSVYCRSA